MATSIDDNEANEKSDKPMCQLINILCTSICYIAYFTILYCILSPSTPFCLFSSIPLSAMQ